MGISTYQCYCGAQIFDAIGLSGALVEQYFTGTATVDRRDRHRGARRGSARRHRFAFGGAITTMLDIGGLYAQRLGGEAHAWTFDSVANLQHAVRGNLPDKYRAFAEEHERAERAAAHPARPDAS